MPSNTTVDDREQIARIRAAWETYDNTGDVSTIADYLAEDIVLMPPGSPPIVGKEDVVKGLTGQRDYDVVQESQALIISGNLAVDRIIVNGTRPSAAGDNSMEIRLKGVDVYRRNPDDTWKCIMAIWNSEF